MTLLMTEAEERTIDSSVEQMMDWAKSNQVKAEQLAMDSARLLSCSSERINRLAKQGFFKRCWSRFTGEAGSIERANEKDLIEMQKYGLRYINMLQENQVLLAHSMISLKNNLYALSVQEEETRNIICNLAQRTLERFEKLENRVDQLEVSTNLNGWIITLEDCEYDEKYPTEYIRLFKIINDFYAIKNDNWVYRDLQFMRTALRIAKLDPKKKITLNIFIDKLVDEIQNENVGFNKYKEIISINKPEGVEKYSQFVVENISSPLFLSIHNLNIQYLDKLEVVEELQDEMNLTIEEALKRLLRRSILNLNVNLDYEFPIAEAAIEILGAIRLAKNLFVSQYDIEDTNLKINSENNDSKLTINNHSLPGAKDIESSKFNNIKEHKEFNNDTFEPGIWKNAELPDNIEDVEYIHFDNDNSFICFFRENIHNRLDIYKTNNFVNWEFIKNIQNDKNCRLSKVYTVKNNLIIQFTSGCYNKSYILISDDMIHFEKIELKINESDININDIMYIDDKWRIIGDYSDTIHYKEKGIIFDSDKYYTIRCGVVLEGNSIDNLNIYKTSSNMERHEIFSLTFDEVSKNYVCISRIIDYNGCLSNPSLKKSVDCSSWEQIPQINLHNFNSPCLKSFNNSIILFDKNLTNYSGVKDCYKVDLQSSSCIKLIPNIKLTNTTLCHVNKLNNGQCNLVNTIAFSFSNMFPPIFVSNDLNTFKKITFPILQNNEIRCFWSDTKSASNSIIEFLDNHEAINNLVKNIVPNLNDSDDIVLSLFNSFDKFKDIDLSKFSDDEKLTNDAFAFANKVIPMIMPCSFDQLDNIISNVYYTNFIYAGNYIVISGYGDDHPYILFCNL